MKIDILCHLLDNLTIDVAHLPPEEEDFLCRSFALLSISGDVLSVPTFYSSFAVGFQKVLGNLNLIRNSSVGLLYRSSDRLTFPGEVIMPPTSYNSYPVGYEEFFSTGTGQGFHGSGFSSWAKLWVLPWRCVTTHFWMRCYSAELLFVGHQLKRDFFLFSSCSGVRLKHDWLRYDEDEAWRNRMFYILWRYMTFLFLVLLVFYFSSMLVYLGLNVCYAIVNGFLGYLAWSLQRSSTRVSCFVSSVPIRVICSDQFLPGEFLRQVRLVGSVGCLGERCFYLLLRRLDLVYASFSAQIRFKVPHPATSPATCSRSASNFAPGFIFVYIVVWASNDDADVISSEHVLSRKLLRRVCSSSREEGCGVIHFWRVLCLQTRGDDLLIMVIYPLTVFWAVGTVDLMSFHQFVYQKISPGCGSIFIGPNSPVRMRDVSVSIIVTVSLVLLLLLDGPATGIGFWLRDSGYEILVTKSGSLENHGVKSCMSFYILYLFAILLVMGGNGVSSLLNSFPDNDKTIF